MRSPSVQRHVSVAKLELRQKVSTLDQHFIEAGQSGLAGGRASTRRFRPAVLSQCRRRHRSSQAGPDSIGPRVRLEKTKHRPNSRAMHLCATRKAILNSISQVLAGLPSHAPFHPMPPRAVPRSRLAECDAFPLSAAVFQRQVT